jgi:hypothetical protein
MNTTAATSTLDEARTANVFLIRGLVAIAWAGVFAAASDSLTTGVTVGVGALSWRVRPRPARPAAVRVPLRAACR